MSSEPRTEETEQGLERDLGELSDAVREDAFAGELYRGLANHRLVDPDDPERRQVALSWRRAEEVVNDLRRHAGEEPLTLAQTGGEGEASDTVADELRRLGWIPRPRDTSAHDDSHIASPPDPPPPGQGERQAPVGPDETDWQERAHAEADAGERLYQGRPGSSAATRGRDPEERARPSS